MVQSVVIGERFSTLFSVLNKAARYHEICREESVYYTLLDSRFISKLIYVEYKPAASSKIKLCLQFYFGKLFFVCWHISFDCVSLFYCVFMVIINLCFILCSIINIRQNHREIYCGKFLNKYSR